MEATFQFEGAWIDTGKRYDLNKLIMSALCMGEMRQALANLHSRLHLPDAQAPDPQCQTQQKEDMEKHGNKHTGMACRDSACGGC